MDKVNKLQVFYMDRAVGTLALHKNIFAAFEYSKEWLADGFSISPFSLPLQKGVFVPKADPFDGLYGVFADSLPDGWGRLVVDRLMRRNGMDPFRLGNLDRLAIVGDSGMGALSYKPTYPLNRVESKLSLDEIATECASLLASKDIEDLDYLFQNGGSSGGARPKILTTIDDEEWMIKFPSSQDDPDIGELEYRYALCAKKCQIEMSEVRLFDSQICKGYFGTKRFDRVNKKRIHMVTAAGLLETSHRIPNLDYDILMRLTLQLTDSMEECEKLYRRMCFNVFAHNRDDHSKNFTYQYLEDESRWILSPAYDLTYSSSLGGEHATTVHGNGSNPGMDDVLAVAKGIGLSKNIAKNVAEEVYGIVKEDLRPWGRSF